MGKRLSAAELPDEPNLRKETVDAVFHEGRQPGEVFELDLSQIPDNKAGDFCMHQFPSVNYLEGLSESGVEVRILAARMKELPCRVLPGLSEEMAGAVPKAVQWLWEAVRCQG